MFGFPDIPTKTKTLTPNFLATLVAKMSILVEFSCETSLQALKFVTYTEFAEDSI
jgi:hypothetical protein